MKLGIQSIVFVVLWSAYIVWTFRAFWRRPTDPKRARLYKEVRFWTVVVTGVGAFATPTQIDLPAFSYWESVAFWAIMLFPNVLLGIYVGFRWLLIVADSRQKK
jgi:hypothetical protein